MFLPSGLELIFASDNSMRTEFVSSSAIRCLSIMPVRTTLVLLLLLLGLSIASDCPPDEVIEPCVCVIAIPSHTYLIFNDNNPDVAIEQQRSIVCEHIRNASFDLHAVFARLSSFVVAANDTAFDSFLLHNTTVDHLPANVFGNVTFTCLMFQDNERLTRIDTRAFAGLTSSVEVFETLNTNLADGEMIFSVLRQFVNLRRISMHNDRLRSIPSNAFNQTNLTQIWLGLENRRTSQSIESIGPYAFYNLTNLRVLRIFSPNLTVVDKYAFAQRQRSTTNTTLHILIGGERLNATSFPLTSLSRFRSRPVIFRLFFTSLTYLDEHVFQPFLESNPSSYLDINQSNGQLKCDCRSAWIQHDYARTVDKLDNRVFGYKCWSYDFKNCTF